MARLAPLVAAFAGGCRRGVTLCQHNLQLQPAPLVSEQTRVTVYTPGKPYTGHPSLMRIVAAATRTTQNTDDAEAWACAGAAVLERLILEGCSVVQALTATVAELRGGSGEQGLLESGRCICTAALLCS